MSNGIDETLRDRVAEEMARFDESFCAAEQDETRQNLEALAEAADRLMRAVARALIEVKRQLGED